jgi:hypothetical protein
VGIVKCNRNGPEVAMVNGNRRVVQKWPLLRVTEEWSRTGHC